MGNETAEAQASTIGTAKRTPARAENTEKSGSGRSSYPYLTQRGSLGNGGPPPAEPQIWRCAAASPHHLLSPSGGTTPSHSGTEPHQSPTPRCLCLPPDLLSPRRFSSRSRSRSRSPRPCARARERVRGGAPQVEREGEREG